MNDSLASLLMKNIDLILEAFNVDEKGNLVEVNKKKVAESDEIFHQYFVKRMNQTFRQINEADPILSDPMNMHPAHAMHGMHAMGGAPHGMGMGDPGDEMDGMGGDDQMGDMAMDDMHAMGGMDQMGHGQMGHGQMGHDQMGDPMGHDQMGHDQMGHGMPMDESDESGDFGWVFGENTDLDVDSLFGLNEWEDDEEKGEHEDEDDDEKHLKEFMDDDQADFLPDGDMDHNGGANDFGGDMGGADMNMPSGMDSQMGGDMGDGMGDGDDMMTIHGHMDNGGEFELSFDKDALGFDGDDMGGEEDHGMGNMGMGGDHHEEHEPHHEQPGMGEDEDAMQEAAGGFHNGKPGKGKKGPKTSKMAVVPANPAANHAAPFPSPMGNRQKKK